MTYELGQLSCLSVKLKLRKTVVKRIEFFGSKPNETIGEAQNKVKKVQFY